MYHDAINLRDFGSHDIWHTAGQTTTGSGLRFLVNFTAPSHLAPTKALKTIVNVSPSSFVRYFTLAIDSTMTSTNLRARCVNISCAAFAIFSSYKLLHMEVRRRPILINARPTLSKRVVRGNVSMVTCM